MKRFIQKSFLSLLILVFLLSANVYAGTQYNAIFTMTAQSVEVGENVEITLSIESTSDVNGILLDTLSYDKNVLEFIEFSEYGDLITTSALGANGVDSSIEEITLGYTNAVTPNGKICKLIFRTKAAGTSEVSMNGLLSKGGKPVENVLSPKCTVVVTSGEEESPFTFSGAQIRIEGEQGLRFIFELDKETYSLLAEEELPSTYDDTGVGFGSVVILGKLLGDETLTKETANAQIVPAVKLYKEPGDIITYTACVIEMPIENYAEEYVAVPYITYMDNGIEKTIYGTQTENITVFNVAELAYNDTAVDTATKEYLYENVLTVVDPDYER